MASARTADRQQGRFGEAQPVTSSRESGGNHRRGGNQRRRRAPAAATSSMTSATTSSPAAALNIDASEFVPSAGMAAARPGPQNLQQQRQQRPRPQQQQQQRRHANQNAPERDNPTQPAPAPAPAPPQSQSQPQSQTQKQKDRRPQQTSRPRRQNQNQQQQPRQPRQQNNPQSSSSSCPSGHQKSSGAILTATSSSSSITSKSNADLLEALTVDLTNQVYDCMVCYDIVRRRERIWACSTCYAVFHLKCITDWARKSASDTNAHVPTRSMESWRCPGCQSFSDTVPQHYSCFCGKAIEPSVNQYLCPHSCGQTCGRDRRCAHRCPLQCHPGPCPPCEFMTQPITCFCDKGELAVRCSELSRIDFSPSCGQPCGRTLDCGKHSCDMRCHPPPCGPCAETATVTCYCGSISKEVSCSDVDSAAFSCNKPCGFMLACGEHRCERICHQEPHEKSERCPFDPSLLNRCPCGKSSIDELLPDAPRLSCTAPVPTCGQQCGQPFPCGHVCEKPCHIEPCPPCSKSSDRPCRCGKQMISILCADLEIDPVSGIAKEPICQRPCGKRLQCRRHRCQETCCLKDDSNHTCDVVCGKQLACKRHNCIMPCGHQGKCHDCVEGVSFDERSCNCGRTIMYPPIPCNAPPIECNHPCAQTRTCGHANISRHYCHDDSEACPPCMILVSRRCTCGAKIIGNIPCSSQGASSCGMPCSGVIQPCGHNCSRACHGGPCADETHPCVAKCGKVRSTCGHVCQYPCHGTNECSESLFCRQQVVFTCACGNRTKKIVCGSTREKPTRGVHVLECDESCARKKRNERLSKALCIDTASKPAASTMSSFSYPEALVRAALGLRDLTLSTEQTLAFLVDDPSKQFHYFPKQRIKSANSFIEQLATQYGFFAQTVDANVGKGTVVVRRVNNRQPTIPPKLLSKAAEEYKNGITDSITTTDPADTVAETLAFEPFAPNAVLVRGVAPDTELADIRTILRTICNAMNLCAMLHWLTDTDFLITYERVEAWSVVQGNDSEIPSMLADRVNVAMVVELGWATDVVECQLMPNQMVRLEDNQLLKRGSGNVTKRGQLAEEDGWTAVRQSRNPGIPINEDVVAAK